MKVLILSASPLKDKSGDNSIQNFFESFDPKQLAHLYLRSELPDTKSCTRFFHISEIAVMKKMLGKRVSCGSEVNLDEIDGRVVEQSNDEGRAKKLYKKSNSPFFLLCREIMWKTGVWKEPSLDSFLDDLNPDYVFIFFDGRVFYWRIAKYVADRLKRPVIIMFGDDHLTEYSRNTFVEKLLVKKIKKYVFALKPYLKQLFVASPLMKEIYDKILGVESKVLIKGIDATTLHFPAIDIAGKKKLKLLYAGNTIYGRDESLLKIARYLSSDSYKGIPCELHIFSPNLDTQKSKKKLLETGVCILHDPVPYQELMEIRRGMDILVFVESFRAKYTKAVWLSFSTKITEYLSTGKPIIAIGPRRIAPIQYFSSTGTAFVIDSLDDMAELGCFLGDEHMQNAIISNVKTHIKALDKSLVSSMMHEAMPEYN